MATRLARFVVARFWTDLSGAARDELKIRILDALGCAFGALDAPPVRAIRAQLDDFGASGATGAAAVASSTTGAAAMPSVGTALLITSFSTKRSRFLYARSRAVQVLRKPR